MLSPLVLPLHGNAAAEAVNRRLLPALVSRAARELGMREPWLWSYVPQAEVLLEALAPSLVVYHCVDDISAHERIDTASFRAAEERFAGRADLVLASAPELARRMRRLSGNVLEAPNVADTELFATALDPARDPDPAIAALPSPRLVFTGAISAVKLDIPLLVELARARRDWSLALVGPVGLGDPTTDVSALAAEPNVHLLGPRAYEELPAVLRGADAGLIPYVRSELTDSIFPMKVYEYLAAGLPVVATPLPALAGVEEVASEPDAASLPRRPGTRARTGQPCAARRALRGRRLALLGRAPARDRERDRGASVAMRDLLVTTHTPVLRSGQTMRTYGIARALAAAGEGLTLLYARFEGAAPDAAFRSIPGIELHEVVAWRGARRALAYARARASGTPAGFARGVSPELAAAAARSRRGARPRARDRRRADRGRGAAGALAPAPGGLQRPQPRVGLPRRAVPRGGLGAGAAALRARAPEPRERVLDGQRRGAGGRARSCAPEHTCATCRTSSTWRRSSPSLRSAEPRAVFVANFAYEPNRNGLRFLLEEVMPLVWERLPRGAAAAGRRRTSSCPAAGTSASSPWASSSASPTPTRAPAARSCRCCRAAARR